MLAGKVAIVTGGGGAGSGGAIARRLAALGAAVVVVDVAPENARQVVLAIEAAGGRACSVGADVRNPEDVRVAFETARRQFGGVDILVNNASGLIYPEQSLDDAFCNLQVDLLGTFYATREAVEAMRTRGGGAIVNIASTSALPHGDPRASGPGATGYNTAKMAVIRLTTSLAWLAAENIRVNCLVPHWIGTPHIREAIGAMTADERREWHVPEVLIEPEDLADCVVRVSGDTELAGRVLLLEGGGPPTLLPWGDPGYARLESW